MRMVCPNCGAQYEVDLRVIPEAGRDVQCSACGHAWYQLPFGHPDASDDEVEVEAATEVAEDRPDPEADEPEDDLHDPEHAADVVPEPEPEPEATEDWADAPEPEPEAEAEAEPEPEAPAPPRREIDDGVRGILQEEAQREIDAREQDTDPGQVETQPDLGLDEVSAEEERRRIARERMARMRGLDDDDDLDAEFGEVVAAQPAAVAPPEAAQRRDLFPDIEEINSTLDSHGDPTGPGVAIPASEKSSGFGRGFFLVILIAVLALVLYIMAPKLAATIPMLEPVLVGYVEMVNQGRAWLDSALQGLVAKLENMVEAGGQ